MIVLDQPSGDPVAVLSAWDRSRAAAWAAGEPELLGPLYVRGSASGRADRRMLEEYADRGLRVIGLRTQVLTVVVARAGPGRLRVVVTDRVAGGEVVGDGVRAPLPRDEPSTRVVALRVVDGRWQVVEAWAQRSAAASTSSTSRSRNS